MSMFAIVVSGRLVQTNFEQIDTNKFIITIPNADAINHIVVFMTGTQPLSPELGASVNFSWPSENSPPVWKYLGFLNNDKPSAIYKISNLRGVIPSQCSGFYPAQQNCPHFAQIGIAIEPIAQLLLQPPEILTKTEADNQLVTMSDNSKLSSTNLLLFVSKTAESLFNHVASFATTFPGIAEQVVPVSSIESWYNNFKRKLEYKPDFWM